MDTDRLSCTTTTFGGDLPRKLAAMASAGFRLTEVYPRDVYHRFVGPEKFVELLRQNGLKVSCFQFLADFEGLPEPLLLRKLDMADQLMGQMALIDADTLVLCANTLDSASSDRGLIIEQLTRLGALAQRHGVRIAYEPICWARWFPDYISASALIAEVDHPCIGLDIDVAHIFALGTSLEGLRDIPMEKVFIAEVSDLPKNRLPHIETCLFHRLFPGDGVFPVDTFIELMESNGYEGVYAVEVLNGYYATEPVDVVAQRAMSSIQKMF